MAQPISLLALTSGAVEGCSRAAEILNELSGSISTSRATFSSVAAECLTTQDVLQRLEAFLIPGTQTASIADYPDRGQLRNCFDVLVQPIIIRLDEVDIELQRLRRYSAEKDPIVHSKLVPILQDSLHDARSSLRRNRASLSLIMDCVQRYVFGLQIKDS